MVSRRPFRLNLLLRALAVGLVSLLLIEVFVLQFNHEKNRPQTITATTRMRTMLTLNAATTESLNDDDDDDEVTRDELKAKDLSYVASKRKVPRGPDPIHNRRAGNSRRPPGRN